MKSGSELSPAMITTEKMCFPALSMHEELPQTKLTTVGECMKV